MRVLPPAPELQLAAYAPSSERAHATATASASLHALGGLPVVLHAAGADDDDWNPAADEHTGGFDIHLGVYTQD
jgi:hypothetical protein